jgi:octaprenyl-diphosphate synthase
MENNNSVLGRYQSHFQRINEQLEEHLTSDVPLIKDVADHALTGSGKRLRPLFFVISSQLCNYRGDDPYALSAIFEYIHTASLLHDDVLDNADVRRRKPSVNRVWGDYTAVLVGDFVFSRASGIALCSGNIDFLKRIIKATTIMSEGQILEFTNAGNCSLGLEEYMQIITAKTAVLISAACACAAIISRADERSEKALDQFGLNVGISFQLIDDLLDYESSEEIIGKPAGKDLVEGKITLPLIYSLPLLESEQRAWLEKKIQSREWTEDETAKALGMVRNTGCLEEVRKKAHHYGEKAASCLDHFPDSEAKKQLLELKQYVIERHY